jgi:hypothetical protein
VSRSFSSGPHACGTPSDDAWLAPVAARLLRPTRSSTLSTVARLVRLRGSTPDPICIPAFKSFSVYTLPPAPPVPSPYALDEMLGAALPLTLRGDAPSEPCKSASEGVTLTRRKMGDDEPFPCPWVVELGDAGGRDERRYVLPARDAVPRLTSEREGRAPLKYGERVAADIAVWRRSEHMPIRALEKRPHLPPWPSRTTTAGRAAM